MSSPHRFASLPPSGTGRATASALVAAAATSAERERLLLEKYVEKSNKRLGAVCQMELYDLIKATRQFRVSDDASTLQLKGGGGGGDCQDALRDFLSQALSSAELSAHDWHVGAALLAPTPHRPPIMHVFCIYGQFEVSGTRLQAADTAFIVTLQSGLRKTIPFQAWWRANKPIKFIRARYSREWTDLEWDDWDAHVYALSLERPPVRDASR